MPAVVVVKSFGVVLALLFGMSFLFLPGANDVQVKLETFQYGKYYGWMEVNGERGLLMVEEEKPVGNKPGKVKVTFNKKGHDYTLTYENDSELVSELDEIVVEQILEQMEKIEEKSPGRFSLIQKRMQNTLSNVVNRESKKRGFITKFLP